MAQPKMNWKQIAIYLRVSTNAQDTASQKAELEAWAKGHEAANPGVVVVWYSDKATGKNMDRPGWQKLEVAMAQSKVAAVVVWRIDRLGRTAAGLTALFEDMATRKVNLISMKEGIDLSTPCGRVMANLLASLAQYETEVRAERVLAGQAAAKAKGKQWGGGVKGRKWKVTKEIELAARDLAAKGTPVARIAATLHISRPTVYTLLAG